MSKYLLKDGRLAFRVRKHLRAFLADKEHRSDYLNDLIDKDFNKPVMSLDESFVKPNRKDKN